MQSSGVATVRDDVSNGHVESSERRSSLRPESAGVTSPDPMNRLVSVGRLGVNLDLDFEPYPNRVVHLRFASTKGAGPLAPLVWLGYWRTGVQELFPGVSLTAETFLDFLIDVSTRHLTNNTNSNGSRGLRSSWPVTKAIQNSNRSESLVGSVWCSRFQSCGTLPRVTSHRLDPTSSRSGRESGITSRSNGCSPGCPGKLPRTEFFRLDLAAIRTAYLRTITLFTAK